jgi:phenylacetate-CoA ligase
MERGMNTDQPISYYRKEIETASRDELEHLQWRKIRRLGRVVFDKNPFYQQRWRSAGLRDWDEIKAMDDFRQLPLVSRDDLAQSQEEHPPYGQNMTWPFEKYVSWYRTSGRKGNPLLVLGSKEDLDFYAESWAYNLYAIGLGPRNVLYIAFSFGPFAGWWGAVSGAQRIGMMMIPGGGQRTKQRLQFIQDYEPDAVASLPSYALRMAKVAEEEGIDLPSSSVRTLIHGGEPGASIPATRARLERAWGAKAYDSVGQSEVGHYGFECVHQSGVHVVESEFFIEVLAEGSDEPVEVGERGELVITGLGRVGTPIIRYRTGDLVRLAEDSCLCGRAFVRLAGGLLSRADEMITVRGVNVFPTAIENLVMGFPEVSDFRAHVYTHRGMKEIALKVELTSDAYATGEAEVLAERVASELRRKLSLNTQVEALAPGSIPETPGKAYRFKLSDLPPR